MPGHVSELVLVTARACLSCRGIGHLIRRISRDDRGGAPLIVIPAADAGDVCPFLKRERIRNGVIAVSDDLFPGAAVGTTVIVAALDSTGSLRSAVSGRESADLVPAVEALRSGL